MPVLSNLKKYREAAGLSPEQLAGLSRDKKTGAPEFSGQLIRRAENGKGTDLLKAKRVAHFLKVKLDDLI